MKELEDRQTSRSFVPPPPPAVVASKKEPVKVQPPKLQVRDIKLPSLPKIETQIQPPPKAAASSTIKSKPMRSLPTPPKTPPQKPVIVEKEKPSKKKETDNFVFSEVSLKSFVNDVRGTDKGATSPPSPQKQQQQNGNDQKKQQEEERQLKLQRAKEEVEAKKRETEEKRAAAAAANQRALKEKQALAAEKQRVIEEKKAVAAEKQRAIEEKRAAEAENKRLLEEERQDKELQNAIAKKKSAEERQRIKDAKQAVGNAKAGATISLGLFGIGQSSPATPSSGPKGVPSISRWKQNRDGSISGFISGSPSFQDGEPVTTSPIKGNPVGGTVATTLSGSR